MKEGMGLKEMRQHRRVAVQQLSHSENNLKKYRELGRRDSMVVYKVRMKALENYISLIDELIKKNTKEHGKLPILNSKKCMTK